MPYRNIFVANSSKLSFKNNQLIVDNGEIYTFPVEDIRSIVIDNYHSTLSTALISKLSEADVCLIVCDGKHLPTTVLLPINSFSRQNKRLILQFQQPLPKLKRIWQQIVISKITNQFLCLEYNGLKTNTSLKVIAKTVQSGDKTNREAYSANLYFKALFGKDFKRSDENIINAALNYGYAILRSFIAKTVVAYGLEPSVGIHHKNEYNSFNLADDLIEPFRPIVDMYVFNNYKKWNDSFSTAQKGELQSLLNTVIISDNEKHSVSFAIERLVQSIINSYENTNIYLKLPVLQEKTYFDYE